MITMPEETPSFLCERVGVELEVVTITDGFPEEFKSNILYMSRGQLKRNTNTVVNFSLNIKHISQQVCFRKFIISCLIFCLILILKPLLFF